MIITLVSYKFTEDIILAYSARDQLIMIFTIHLDPSSNIQSGVERSRSLEISQTPIRRRYQIGVTNSLIDLLTLNELKR